MPERNTTAAYLETVAEQIRWKRARPILIRELERHLEDQREGFLQEGKSPEEAERLAVEDMGDPVALGTELDAVHRPRPQWGLLGLTIALALAGVVLRTFFFRTNPDVLSVYVFTQALASLILGTAAMLGLYFLDVSRLARHARALYIGTLVLGAGMFWYVVYHADYTSASSLYYISYFLQFLLIVYALWVYTWRNKRWKGLLFAIAGGVPLTVIAMLRINLNNLLLFLFTGWVLMLLAAWQNWFGVGRWKGLGAVLGVTFSTLAYLFSLGYFNLFLARLQIALHPELDPLGRGFAGWMTRMFWEDVRPFRNSLGSAGIGAVSGGRSFNGHEWVPFDFGHDFLPAELARAWGWVPLLLLLAALAALLLWLLVKGLRQKYLLGRFVVLAVAIPLAIQTLFSMMLNFGFILSSASLPLVVGNLQTIVDMALIGLALSVFRGDSIAREEPTAPLRPRKRLRIRLEYL